MANINGMLDAKEEEFLENLENMGIQNQAAARYLKQYLKELR